MIGELTSLTPKSIYEMMVKTSKLLGNPERIRRRSSEDGDSYRKLSKKYGGSADQRGDLKGEPTIQDNAACENIICNIYLSHIVNFQCFRCVLSVKNQVKSTPIVYFI